MTLIVGAKCGDGVVLVADSKLTEDISGLQFSYDNKITGGLAGILTAFSGDRGTFQIFTTRLRDYVTTTGKNLSKEAFQKPGLTKAKFGPTIDKVSLEVHSIQHDLYSKYRGYDFEVLMVVSGKYYTPNKSTLFYFYPDGRVLPVKDFRLIGSGNPFAMYYIKRYWQEVKTEMKKFAQLADFTIRYVESETFKLDNAVGLNPERPYPQIIYMPDNQEYCKPYNKGKPREDCRPNEHELKELSRTPMRSSRVSTVSNSFEIITYISNKNLTSS